MLNHASSRTFSRLPGIMPIINIINKIFENFEMELSRIWIWYFLGFIYRGDLRENGLLWIEGVYFFLFFEDFTKVYPCIKFAIK